MPVVKTENNIVDISQNLTIEQILMRAYRMLSREKKAEYDAWSRRTGIPLIKLLEEAVERGLPKVKRKRNPRPVA